jgi:hypothetical protein
MIMVLAERTVGAGGAAVAADGAAANSNAVRGDQNVPGDGGNAGGTLEGETWPVLT